MVIMVYHIQNSSNFSNDSDCYSKYTSLKRVNSAQRSLQGGLHEAVLINIVAAVNGDANDERGTNVDTCTSRSVIDAFSDTDTVISNAVSARERTVSIPSSKVALNMPSGTVVQKKPVYYKNSEYEVNKNRLTKVYGGGGGKLNRITHNKRPFVNKQALDKPKPVFIEKIVKKLPATTPILSQNGGAHQQHESVRKPHATSWSPVRRLGALKKTNSRTLHETSKCDVIDIKLANEGIAGNMPEKPDSSIRGSQVLGRHTTNIPPPPVSRPHPFYRSKSLPVVLPAKSNKTTRSSQRYASRICKNTPVSKHYGKDPAIYGSMKHVSTGFKDEELTISNSFSQNQTKVIAISRELRLHTPNTNTPRLSLKYQARLQPRGLLRKDSCNTTTVSTSTDLQTDTTEPNTSRSEPPLPEATDIRNGRTSPNESIMSEKDTVSKSIRTNTNSKFSENQKSGILTKTTSLTDAISDRKSLKHVQFAGRPGSSSSDSSGHNNISQTITAYGDSSMAQPNACNMQRFYPGIQPLTAQELLRLNQKYIPTNVRNDFQNRQRLNFSNTSAMKIQAFNRSTSEMPMRTVSLGDNEDTHSMGDSDASTDDGDLSTSDSDDDDTLSDSDEEECESDEITIPDETKAATDKREPKKKRTKYKFVKAVDLDSYTGYEHKKLRNVYKGPFVSKSSDDPLANFVKVRVRDVFL